MAVSLFGGSPHIGAPAHTSCNHPTSAKEFRPWSARVWNPAHWKRKRPKQSTLKAQRRQLACAGPANKRAIKRIWKEDQRAFCKHRKQMIWLEKYKPFIYPSGKRWAAPWPVVACESGENYYASPSGAYGEIPPLPQNQSPRVQDEIAYHLLHTVGEYRAWAEWETACPYR